MERDLSYKQIGILKVEFQTATLDKNRMYTER